MSVQEARDPFADDVLERLIASNHDYQRKHGHYIVPLAQRLLDARARIAELETEATPGLMVHRCFNKDCRTSAYAAGYPACPGCGGTDGRKETR